MGTCFLFLALSVPVAPSPRFQAGFGGWVYLMGCLGLKGGLVEVCFVVVDLCLCL